MRFSQPSASVFVWVRLTAYCGAVFQRLRIGTARRRWPKLALISPS